MESNVVINSCLMLACALYTPVDLSSIFEDEDLKDTGIEKESHITLLYAQNKVIDRSSLLDDIRIILDDSDKFSYTGFIDSLKDDKFVSNNVLDSFDIGKFENDSDYIVLKLKKSVDIFNILNIINKGLRIKYDVQSEFSYTPHITLAELKPGTADKYLASGKLKLVLENTKIKFEDLIISYGPSNVVEDREKYNLTTFHAVDRFFREENLKREEPI